MRDLSVPWVLDTHSQMLATPGEPADLDAEGDAGAAHWVVRNHHFNRQLWLAEDEARRTDVADAVIVRCKRAIDRYNQQRNDAVERIDECLLAAYADVELQEGARQHSETPGAMIDRLSILALKIHHMHLQSLRSEAGPEHVRRCSDKLAVLQQQRSDLASCLTQLLLELGAGTACCRVYRQFKMYNDPALNPALYGATLRAAA